MAMQQLTLPGEIVKKHNELVRSKITIDNKTSARILACLIAAIRHDETHFKEAYTVPVKDYLPLDEGGGKGGKQYRLVKEACSQLAKATFEREWPDPDPDATEPIFEVVPFFTSVRYRKGLVSAKFNPELSSLLLQLRGLFTELNLIEYLALPSTYSQRLFEILKSWSGLPEVVLSVSKLHRLLDTPPSFRANFKALRIYVLEKAHKDITTQTSFRYEWEPVKVGRSVEKIRFIFSSKKLPLAQKDQEKAKEEKRQRLINQRFLRAVECARAKGGDCRTMDNVRIVCKLCREKKICC
jgi:plasmid replication initiation protein